MFLIAYTIPTVLYPFIFISNAQCSLESIPCQYLKHAFASLKELHEKKNAWIPIVGLSHNLSNRSPMRAFVFVVQALSCVQLFATPWTATRQAPLSSTVSRSLLKFMCIELVMLSNHESL